jgi:hypothetical protein
MLGVEEDMVLPVGSRNRDREGVMGGPATRGQLKRGRAAAHSSATQLWQAQRAASSEQEARVWWLSICEHRPKVVVSRLPGTEGPKPDSGGGAKASEAAEMDRARTG